MLAHKFPGENQVGRKNVGRALALAVGARPRERGPAKQTLLRPGCTGSRREVHLSANAFARMIPRVGFGARQVLRTTLGLRPSLLRSLVLAHRPYGPPTHRCCTFGRVCSAARLVVDHTVCAAPRPAAAARLRPTSRLPIRANIHWCLRASPASSTWIIHWNVSSERSFPL